MPINQAGNIVTDEINHKTTICGYEAELIRIQAERSGKTPDEFVLSFFGARCNAPTSSTGLRA